MSTSIPKMNKAIAGFHMLMILSSADNRFAINEDMVIRKYISVEFPFRLNMDREINIISGLTPEERTAHFKKCMDDFDKDATDEEKKNFLQFAINMCKSDDIISKNENLYIDLLFRHWYPE